MRTSSVVLLCVSLALLADAAPGLAQELRFQKALVSVNLSKSQSGGSQIQPGGRVTITNTSVRDMLRVFYDIPDFAIVGAPAWLSTERYDVQAEAGGNPSRDDLKQMMRNLLADHFKLVVHREHRQVPLFELKVARPDSGLGPGLVKASTSCEVGGTDACPHELGAGSYMAKAMPMPRLIRTLAELAGRPIIDRTNLAGLFDVSLKWTLGESIISAVREQLGLDLVAREELAEVLAIVAVVRPTQ